MVEKTYDGDGVSVHWDSSRCIHVAACIRAAPEVFDSSARPWINLEGASAELVAKAVAKCPTGALKFTSDVVKEDVPTRAQVRPMRGGPMFIRGPVEVTDHQGRTLCNETRVALCRCGNSSNQPFCDNAHRTDGFDEVPLRAPAVEAQGPGDICEPQQGVDEG